MEQTNPDYLKKFKLSIFLPTHFGAAFDEDVFLNKEDFPNLVVGDIVELHQNENETEGTYKPRLLLMVGPHTLNNENRLSKPLNRETVYVEKSIADTFSLQRNRDVNVRKVDPSSVVLETVELTFKDQYMGRGEMWRVKRKLEQGLVFLNKKIAISQGTVRCQVSEMWTQGERVACGVVNSETKIVFRSLSSMIYLFIQMSSEMWDFDIHGNLFYEKAVKGFLSEMFSKWRSYGSSHEVTIVLFSRIFYEATNRSQFPTKMQECLQVGFNGKFYEDFYSVVVQNERFTDWTHVLVTLRKSFANYKNSIMNTHKSGSCTNQVAVPQGYISNASQGNFLEVLNMSLNTFENHYLNRNLDRTGQQCLVLTPGVGLFEVDRELMLMTKQRILDSGVGSDLICLGEQPLHAVPLFKLYNKGKAEGQGRDAIYCMPHWINLSFYVQPRAIGNRTPPYVPRVRLANDVENFIPEMDSQLSREYFPRIRPLSYIDPTSDPFKGFDDFDDSVFKCEYSAHRQHSLVRSVTLIDSHSMYDGGRKNSGRESLKKHSYAGIIHQSADSFYEKDSEEVCGENLICGNEKCFDHQAIKKYLLRPGRALINPFDTSLTEIRLTSNRRRWTHIFPKSVKSKLDVSPMNTEPYFQDGVEVENIRRRSCVDWKSLTFPAILPLTTDFFPSQESLVCDFLVNEYELRPEDIWSDCHHSPLYKCSVTNEDVFTELINQRIAQGFQLIVFPNDQNSHKCSVGPIRPLPTSDNFVWVSIGRIYHRVALSNDKKQIKITCYRPRVPHHSINYHYRYRFSAPDTGDYEVSWIEFETEEHEKFNWNRMDFYICTRGDKDFVLTENLKYWRYRIYVLPMSPFQQYTKKILDGSCSHVNMYSRNSDQSEQMESFLRYLEFCMNKLKRNPMVVTTEKQRSRSAILHPTRKSSSTIPSSLRVQRLRSSAGLGSTLTDHLTSPNSFPNFSPELLNVIDLSHASSELIVRSESPERQPQLHLSSTLIEIIDAMKSNSSGITFFNTTNGLPPLTFVADDAISWIANRVEGVDGPEHACQILDSMISKNLICHASGNKSHQFKNWMHLFHVVQTSSHTDNPKYDGDLEAFQTDWLEVEALKEEQWNSPSEIPDFLEPQLSRFHGRESAHSDLAGRFYKCITFDTDHNSRSERPEWAHLKYQRRYDPSSTYELTLQWSAATGSIVSDLIYSWARKAQQGGFSFIPVPHDPFALPITKNSDPVRGPIFIELEVESILEGKSHLFEDFHESSWEDRMLLFREEVAFSFGFVSCATDRGNRSTSSSQFCTHHQYIHCTGNMFLLIPTRVQLQMGIQGIRRKISSLSRQLSSSFECGVERTKVEGDAEVTRHLIDGTPEYNRTEVGFLWSWNFMISKRWKQLSNPTGAGDIEFMDKMLADFRSFCRNDNNRLRDFWDRCLERKKI